jgi:hypothetical protein
VNNDHVKSTAQAFVCGMNDKPNGKGRQVISTLDTVMNWEIPDSSEALDGLG